MKGFLRHCDRPSIDFTSSFYTSLWNSIKTVYLVLLQLLSLRICFVLFQLECSSWYFSEVSDWDAKATAVILRTVDRLIFT